MPVIQKLKVVLKVTINNNCGNQRAKAVHDTHLELLSKHLPNFSHQITLRLLCRIRINYSHMHARSQLISLPMLVQSSIGVARAIQLMSPKCGHRRPIGNGRCTGHPHLRQGANQQSVDYHTNTKPIKCTARSGRLCHAATSRPITSQSATVHDTTTTCHGLERSVVHTLRSRRSKPARHLKTTHIWFNITLQIIKSTAIFEYR